MSTEAVGRTTPSQAGTVMVKGRPHSALFASQTLGPGFRRWPVVLRLLAENVGRCVQGPDRDRMLGSLRGWIHQHTSEHEIHFSPGRLLMHDTTSTPALVDMAAMRDAISASGGDPTRISPVLPVEVSVDHSLAVEAFGRPDAPAVNIREEIRRNRERYRFLKWSSAEMDGLHINPPGTGIMHTINLEQLATVVTTEVRDGVEWVIPDQMLGTDSHTPMINGLGVLGWGVGGLEAETVMFGMPTTLRIPDVVGVRLTGSLGPGALATDFALTVTHRLRQLGVTAEFVEFFGPGVATLTVGERAVVANMAPEYGATTGYFPIDDHTLAYLQSTGRSSDHIEMVRTVAQATGLWFEPDSEPEYTRTVEINLSNIQTSAAGPRRPQDLLPVSGIPAALDREAATEPPRLPADVTQLPAEAARADAGSARASVAPDTALPLFPVALASITSCTNTTDPRLLIAAGLLARRARQHGLRPPEWVKTSLAPGSPAAASYLKRAGLSEDLSAVGFDIVGFGCATCIGNSGSLTPQVEQARANGLVQPVAILSGNRNFPGRVHPDLDLGFLLSPPMVVAYGLAGDAHWDVASEPLGVAADGMKIYLSDLWPSAEEIDRVLADAVDPSDFARDFRAASRYRLWEEIEAPTGPLFPWDEDSTMLRPPPFAAPGQGTLLGRYAAHPLLVLGDDITTDHISPASAIPQDSFIADFLVGQGEDRKDLNVFASRRGNWEVMARGAYYAKSVRNALTPGGPTAHTVHGPSGELMSIWDAAGRYSADGDPVVVVAGDRYGMGSSRDWAAKVQRLLGVRAVLASSYERIHRSNLIGMGILPLLVPDEWRERLSELRPGEQLHVDAPAHSVAPGATVPVTILGEDAAGAAGTERFEARIAVETDFETGLLRAGGVIPTILSHAGAEPVTH
ncbi:aconitate hydratase AcnA [Citricoccus sp.]|uniref:aconitate hydratase AcnA n=1 Tax=Citricoccus sp. TaxID=1978372 RepID=UPI0028BE8F27|nr:aconitate hydratase AcnA [Citricoccus sp.]